MTLYSNLVQLIMPQFIENRALYEIRESPSRTYSWRVFILSNVIAEIPWQTFMAVILLATWYFPLGMYLKVSTSAELSERAGLTFLFLWSFMLFSSTLAYGRCCAPRCGTGSQCRLVAMVALAHLLWVSHCASYRLVLKRQRPQLN